MSYYTSQGSSRSPPPLQHPIPTHPLNVPEPPSTPVSANAGYQRFTSSPSLNHPQSQQIHTSPLVSYQQNVYPQQPVYLHQPGPGMQGAGQSHPLNSQFTGMWGVNDATAQLGIQLGQNAVAAGQEYVQKNVCLFPLKDLFSLIR